MALDNLLQRVDSSEEVVLRIEKVVARIPEQASLMTARMLELASEAVSSQIERAVSGLVTQTAKMNANLGQLASETVAEKQLDQATQATNQLKRFNDDLIFSLETALEEKIGNRLAPSLEKLVTAMEALRADQSHDSKEMIQQVVQDFTDALQKGTGSETERMVATLTEANNAVQDSTRQIAASQARLSSAFTDQLGAITNAMESNTAGMTESLRASLEQVTATMTELSKQVARQLEESSATATSTQEQLSAAMGSNTAAMTSALNASLAEVKATVADLSKQVTSQFTGQLEAATSAMESNTGGMTDSLRISLEQVTATIRELFRRVTEQFERSNRAATEHVRCAVESSTHALAAAGSDAAARINASWKQLEPSAERLERSIHQSGQMLDAMGGFLGQLSALHTTVQATHESIATIARPIEQAAGDIRTSSDLTREAMFRTEVAVTNLAKYEKDIAAAWEHYQDRFEGLDASLKSVFSQLRDGLENYLTEVASFVTVLDVKTASSIKMLGGATDELGERIEELSDSLERARIRR